MSKLWNENSKWRHVSTSRNFVMSSQSQNFNLFRISTYELKCRSKYRLNYGYVRHYLRLTLRKPFLLLLYRITEAQIRLRIRAVWSAPFLFPTCGEYDTHFPAPSSNCSLVNRFECSPVLNHEFGFSREMAHQGVYMMVLIISHISLSYCSWPIYSESKISSDIALFLLMFFCLFEFFKTKMKF